eukprot:6827359-Alexandrium_andersonii.AAC.1
MLAAAVSIAPLRHCASLGCTVCASSPPGCRRHPVHHIRCSAQLGCRGGVHRAATLGAPHAEQRHTSASSQPPAFSRWAAVAASGRAGRRRRSCANVYATVHNRDHLLRRVTVELPPSCHALHAAARNRARAAAGGVALACHA